MTKQDYDTIMKEVKKVVETKRYSTYAGVQVETSLKLEDLEQILKKLVIQK